MAFIYVLQTTTNYYCLLLLKSIVLLILKETPLIRHLSNWPKNLTLGYTQLLMSSYLNPYLFILFCHYGTIPTIITLYSQ